MIQRKDTKIFNTVDLSTPEAKEGLTFAAGVLCAGGLAAFPTETVYGLGADALNGEAVASIYAAKGRPSDNPLICHIGSVEDMEKLASRIPEDALRLAERYQVQMKYYKKALAEILEREVDECYLYFLDAGKSVKI